MGNISGTQEHPGQTCNNQTTKNDLIKEKKTGSKIQGVLGFLKHSYEAWCCDKRSQGSVCC